MPCRRYAAGAQQHCAQRRRRRERIAAATSRALRAMPVIRLRGEILQRLRCRAADADAYATLDAQLRSAAYARTPVSPPIEFTLLMPRSRLFTRWRYAMLDICHITSTPPPMPPLFYA